MNECVFVCVGGWVGGCVRACAFLYNNVGLFW